MRNEKKLYPLMNKVPFEMRKIVSDKGVEYGKVAGKNCWYCKTEKKRKEIDKEIEEYLIKQRRDEEKVKEMLFLNNNSISTKKEEIINNSVNCELKTELEINVKPEIYKDFEWETYFKNTGWNSLDVVQKIKENGLPKEEKLRIYILKNLRNSKNMGDYNVVYLDLCEYAAAFKNTYPYELIDTAFRVANLKNGYNFELKVGTSDLSEELKELLLYVFPIHYRNSILEKEKYLG